MKTYQFEQRIKNAKLMHKNNRMQTCFANGILTRHLYSGEQKESLSWWDDFGFILNDYRVSVVWSHPRQVFRDFIESEAIELVLKNNPELAQCTSSAELKQKPVYKKVGRSRKKVKWYEFGATPDDDYLTRLKEKELELEESTEFQALPSFDITWTNRSRLVIACIPMEIRTESDLVSLASVVRQLIRRDITMNDLFPGFRYTRWDWKNEAELRGKREFYVHTIR